MSLAFWARSFGSYARDYIVGATKSRPAWLSFTKDIARWTGHTKLLDLTTGYLNLERFVFMSNTWTIGGVAFDGIMKTEHSHEIKATSYPVQTGVVMTDHAIILPSVLDIDVMVSDANPDNALNIKTGNRILDAGVGYVVKRFLTNKQSIAGNERAASAMALLVMMAQMRMPITVVTRLGTYQNMLLKKVTSVDTVETLYALRASLHLEQIQVADVSEVAVSARKQTTDSTAGGAKPVSGGTNQNQTALKAASKALGGL